MAVAEGSENKIDQSRLALAAIVASVVWALDEHSPGVRASALARLEKMYRRLNEAGSHLDVLETLDWTHHLLNDAYR
jgi:hypothetical protein